MAMMPVIPQSKNEHSLINNNNNINNSMNNYSNNNNNNSSNVQKLDASL